MVDADREKISKSKQGQGVYEKPQTAEAYVKKHGADIVRLWVASQDYRNDMVVSEERIAKVAETYRGIRNALRYQLSNLYDFDPAKHTVPDDKLTGLDRWILGEFSKAGTGSHQSLRRLRIPRRLSKGQPVHRRRAVLDLPRRDQGPALHRPGQFASPPLDPDRFAPAGDRAYARCSHRFWRLRQMRHGSLYRESKANSVHESEWQANAFALAANEIEDWAFLLKAREIWLPFLEVARRDKIIGKSLDAKIQPAAEHFPELVRSQDLRDSFKELLNVSQIHFLTFKDNPNATVEALGKRVVHADGQKCERCWHWETDVGSNPGASDHLRPLRGSGQGIQGLNFLLGFRCQAAIKSGHMKHSIERLSLMIGLGCLVLLFATGCASTGKSTISQPLSVKLSQFKSAMVEVKSDAAESPGKAG